MTLPHHSLVAWQRADDLFLKVHLLSRAFPAIERFELASQLRRAAYSVAANIVEGFSRHGTAERLHFLQMSLGEVGYCLHAARRLGYIGETDYMRLESDVRKTAAPLRGLMKALGRPNP